MPLRCVDIHAGDDVRSVAGFGLAALQTRALGVTVVGCLVTGAAGFAGGHLLRELLSRGCRIAAGYYRTTPPADPALADIQWLMCDARSAEQTRRLIESLRPQNIIHLAAASMPSEANNDPRVAVETNVNGWVNLLEAVRDLRRPCRVLLVSSYYVYGAQNPGVGGFNETVAPQPGDVYTATRVLGEMVARRFAEKEGVEVMIARVGNHVGPGQRRGYFVSSLADQIARIELKLSPPVVRVGNIDVARDITDVRDVVRAYADLLERGRPGQVYNVCSGRPTSLRSVVEIFASMARATFEVQVDPQRIRSHDPAVVFADRSKLTRETGWRPEIDLPTTLVDVLNSCRQGLARTRTPRRPTPEHVRQAPVGSPATKAGLSTAEHAEIAGR